MAKHSIEVNQASTTQSIEVPALAPHEELLLEPGATGVHYEPDKTLYGHGLDVQAEAQRRALQPEDTTPKAEDLDAHQDDASALTSEALRLAVGAKELMSKHSVPEQEDLGYMPQTYQPGKDLPQRR